MLRQNNESRIILANTVSPFMTSRPDDDYQKKLNAANSRKSLLLYPGDILITASPLDVAHRNYLLSIVGVNPSAVEFLSPQKNQTPFLPQNVLNDSDLLDHIRKSIAKRGITSIQTFILDQHSHDLAHALDLPISHYTDSPEILSNLKPVISTVKELNTKSGFKDLAKSLGIPTPEYEIAHNRDELEKSLSKFLADGLTAIIKMDRSTNGQENLQVQSLEEYQRHKDRIDIEGPESSYLVEQFHSTSCTPSVEIFISDSGAQVLGISDTYCPNNSWQGELLPAKGLSQVTYDQINRAAEAIGNHLFQKGYRGSCDLDGLCLKTGDWLATECNIRTTGGTHIHFLGQRLFGKDFRTKKTVMMSKSRNPFPTFQALYQCLDKEDLLFDGSQGVIITSCLAFRDFRYIIFDKNLERVDEQNRRLQKIIAKQPGYKEWEEEDSSVFIDYGDAFTPSRQEIIDGFVHLTPKKYDDGFRALEIGPGDGWLAEAMLSHYSNLQLHLLDNSEAMQNASKGRLQRHQHRISYLKGDLHESKVLDAVKGDLSLIYSSLAIHHLDFAEKELFYKAVFEKLQPGGTLMICDLVAPVSSEQQQYYSHSWDKIVRQQSQQYYGGAAAYEHFISEDWNYFTTMSDPIDKPSPLFAQLKLLEKIGFRHVDAFWIRAGHAIFGGYKPEVSSE